MMTMAQRTPSKPVTQLKRFEFPVDDEVINGFLDAQVSRSFPTTMRSLVYLFVKEHGYVDVLGLVGSMFNDDVDSSGVTAPSAASDGSDQETTESIDDVDAHITVTDDAAGDDTDDETARGRRSMPAAPAVGGFDPSEMLA